MQHPALRFHPSSSLLDLLDDEEPEEEMYKIVNTNKHISNGNDGGRTRKMRHISKIQTFKRGHDAIKPFCKDLFAVKKIKEAEEDSTMEHLT